MTRERNVPKAVLFKMIKSKKPFGMMGLLFTFVSLFIILPILFFMLSAFIEPQENYDFEAIEKSGTMADATVINVFPMDNVSVNGRNPMKVDYEYTMNGKTFSDTFQTFDIENDGSVNPGDRIKIRSYNGESAIDGMKPYVFPVFVFFMLPGMFFIIGSVFLLISVLPALKKYKLYKTGIVKDAEIISMAPQGFGLPGLHQQSLMVNYYFTGHSGRVFGESVTDEYSLLHEKKSGDTVKIFVSEEDESKSCLVPKLESLKYNWNI